MAAVAVVGGSGAFGEIPPSESRGKIGETVHRTRPHLTRPSFAAVAAVFLDVSCDPLSASLPRPLGGDDVASSPTRGRQWALHTGTFKGTQGPG